jgi:nitrile hydratase
MSHDEHEEHEHDHEHHHEHDHASGAPHRHPPRKDDDDTLTYYRVMEIAVRELLIEKGVFTADDVRAAVERMDARTPAQGARIVARAWTDPEYKARLLKDATGAITELKIDLGVIPILAVENTPHVHNMIVCTLCSCYPRMVLGPPPDWYKSRNYRSRAVREPRAVLREIGTEIADKAEVRVHDSTADMRYLVIPMRPEGTEGWSEERLAALVTRDSMIGVSLAKKPAAD